MEPQNENGGLFNRSFNVKDIKIRLPDSSEYHIPVDNLQVTCEDSMSEYEGWLSTSAGSSADTYSSCMEELQSLRDTTALASDALRKLSREIAKTYGSREVFNSCGSAIRAFGAAYENRYNLLGKEPLIRDDQLGIADEYNLGKVDPRIGTQDFLDALNSAWMRLDNNFQLKDESEYIKTDPISFDELMGIGGD